jgi:hypothetical protein
MSLSAFAPGLARSLITAAGTVVTFRRSTVAVYDPISCLTTPPAVTTWTARAVVVPNAAPTTNPTESLPVGTGQSRRIRTLLVSGLGIIRPTATDVVVVGGTEHRVTDVTDVGAVDAGTVPAYRVECAA